MQHRRVVDQQRHANLSHKVTEYNLLLPGCVDSSSLTNDELEALLSPPATRRKNIYTRATRREVRTDILDPKSDVMSGSVGEKANTADCRDLETHLSPPNSPSNQSGALSFAMKTSAVVSEDPLSGAVSKGPGYNASDLLKEQSYRWKKNSCWLDSSLELIFQAVQRDWAAFSR